MNPTLEERARRVRSRQQVRAWEYRQRHHAKGVWASIRRSLAEASQAFVIPEPDAQRLMATGSVPEAAGLKLEPQLFLLFVSHNTLAGIPGRREVPVSLELLRQPARYLALVPFQGTRRDRAVQAATPHG